MYFGSRQSGFFGGTTSGGGGGGGTVVSVGIISCGGICVLGGSPVVSAGNICLCSNPGVEVLGSGTCSTYRCCVNNLSAGAYSASLGGRSNSASGNCSAIVGGFLNSASDCYSFISGGSSNCVCNKGYLYGGIGNGNQNLIICGLLFLANIQMM